MSKWILAVKIVGWIEVATLVSAAVVLQNMNRYPQMLLIWSIPVAVIGFYTVGLKPMGRNLNVLLSPLIVAIYGCGFFMIFERILPVTLTEKHFYAFCLTVFVAHVFFFTRPSVKKEFGIF